MTLRKALIELDKATRQADKNPYSFIALAKAEQAQETVNRIMDAQRRKDNSA